MNFVKTQRRQQMGYGFDHSYDFAVKKLSCLKIDEYLISQTTGGDPSTLACKFAEAPGYKHILALANEEGAVAIQNIYEKHTHRNTDLTPPTIPGTAIHYNAIFDLAWKFEEMKLVTASGDHTTRLWTVTESEVIQDRLFLSHDRSVKTVAFQKGSSLFASGGRDSVIYVWDTRSQSHAITVAGRPDSAINCSQLQTPGSKATKKVDSVYNRINSITGLVFQDDNTLVSCSAGEGTIRCWDLRKSYTAHNHKPLSKYVLPYLGNSSRRGYTNLLVDPSTLRLYASCLDDRIYCYNIGTYSSNAVMEYKGHQTSNSFYVKTCLSPDGQYLLSGSFDKKAYIWNINDGEPIATLNGHEAEVTCVAWCQSSELILVTCSDEAKHKIWRISHDEQQRPNDLAGTTEEYIRTKKPIRPRSPPIFESLQKRARLYEACPEASTKRPASSPPQSTPTKRARRLFDDTSTNSNTLATILVNSKSNTGLPEDILSNLPNFVKDGTAPHLRIISPQKRIQSKDWIGQFRKEKEIRQRMLDECSGDAVPNSPKSVRFADLAGGSNSPRSTGVKTPRQRKRKPSSDTPPRAQSPLLKYFKVTANNTNGQLGMSPTSSHLSPFSTNKKMW